jgi:hypothetical protein
MKNYCIISIWILVLFYTVSCGKIETEEIIGSKSAKPVLLGVLRAGDSISIILTQTTVPGIHFNKCPYPEARVFLSVEDSAWKELKRIKADTNVFADTSKNCTAISGKKYKIRVQLAGLVLSSQTTVPYQYGTIEGGSIDTAHLGATIKYTATNNDYDYYMNIIGVIKNGKDTLRLGNPISVDKNKQSITTKFFRNKENNEIQGVDVSIETRNKDLSNFELSAIIADYNYNLTTTYEGLFTVIFSSGAIIPTYSNIVNGYGLFSAVAVSKSFIIK